LTGKQEEEYATEETRAFVLSKNDKEVTLPQKMRLSTAEVLMFGVLDKPAVRGCRPKDFEGIEIDEDEWTEDALLNGLKEGGLSTSMYYGCWDIWKTEQGFSGELFQCREISESFIDKDADYAFEKAKGWTRDCSS